MWSAVLPISLLLAAMMLFSVFRYRQLCGASLFRIDRRPATLACRCSDPGGDQIRALIRELMRAQDKGQARDSPVSEPGVPVHQAGLHSVGVAGAGPQARHGPRSRPDFTVMVQPMLTDAMLMAGLGLYPACCIVPVSDCNSMLDVGTSCARQCLLISMEMSRQITSQSKTCRISYEHVRNDSLHFFPTCTLFATAFLTELVEPSTASKQVVGRYYCTVFPERLYA